MIITQNVRNNPKKIFLLIKKAYKEKGFFKTISSIIRVSTNRLTDLFLYKVYFLPFKSNQKFVFNNETYHYFYHPYNTTWKNERIIEIPLITRILKQNKGKKFLEIGNVLSHYFPFTHDILDKYEEAENVINEDVKDFSPKVKYSFIISVSTLEHVGWDEVPKDPEKIHKALKNLKNCLNPSGKIIFTTPLGENPYLDNLIKNKKLKLDEVHCFKKISNKNKWKQVNFEELKNIKYNSPFPKVNGLILGVIKK